MPEQRWAELSTLVQEWTAKAITAFTISQDGVPDLAPPPTGDEVTQAEKAKAGRKKFGVGDQRKALVAKLGRFLQAFDVMPTKNELAGVLINRRYELWDLFLRANVVLDPDNPEQLPETEKTETLRAVYDERPPSLLLTTLYDKFLQLHGFDLAEVTSQGTLIDMLKTYLREIGLAATTRRNKAGFLGVMGAKLVVPETDETADVQTIARPHLRFTTRDRLSKVVQDGQKAREIPATQWAGFNAPTVRTQTEM